jgi:hypothetical protein
MSLLVHIQIKVARVSAKVQNAYVLLMLHGYIDMQANINSHWQLSSSFFQPPIYAQKLPPVKPYRSEDLD